MEKVFKYYAFISYKHEDEKWAKWLQKRLETYRLPVALQKQNCPKHLKPVFRDNTDMTPGNLEERLNENLERSNYLIVICSKNLAKESHYVDYEMQTFMDLGRGDKIIPFIVDGEPNADDPNEECFSEFIKNFPGELLAANVKKDGKHLAALKVIAAILYLDADDLIKRDRKRKTISRIISGIMAIFVMVFFYIMLDLRAQNFEKEAVKQFTAHDSLGAIEASIKSLKVPFNKDAEGEAAQILRSEVVANELKKTNSQLHKECDIEASHKSVGLFAESSDGGKVGFTDAGRVYVYNSKTLEYVGSYNLRDDKPELNKLFGTVDYEGDKIIKNNYEYDKEPIKHTEEIVERDDETVLYIYDENGRFETLYFIDEKTAEWTYTESEDIIAIYRKENNSTISIHSFEKNKTIDLICPDEYTGISDMYFSPKGRYLFVDFYVHNGQSFVSSSLCIYDIESRQIVFEREKNKEASLSFWCFSLFDRQSFYVFDTFKIEKYSYQDKVPEFADRVIYEGGSDYVICDKNKKLINIYFSDNGSRALTVHSFRNSSYSDGKTLYTVFDINTGEHFMWVLFNEFENVIDITPDMKFMIIYINDAVMIYDIETCTVLYEVDCPYEEICSVGISKDGKYAAYVNEYAEITVIKNEEGVYDAKTVTSIEFNDLYKVILSVNGEECIANCNGTVCAYNIETGESRTIKEDMGFEDSYTYFSRFNTFKSSKILNDGLFLDVEPYYGEYGFYDIETGEDYTHNMALLPCEYSPESGLLVGADYTNQEQYSATIIVMRFDKNNNTVLYEYISSIEVDELRFDNKGKYIIINGMDNCEVLDALTGDLLFTLDRNILIHDDIVYDISADLILPDALPHAEIYSLNGFIREGKKIIK